MSSIIVVFPRREVAVNIRNILMKGGIETAGSFTTGAQALQCADLMDEGIVVCGYHLPDMMYTELRECLPDTFELLLIASPDKWGDESVKGVVKLAMPLKIYDLLNTVEMMLQAMWRRKQKRREERKNRNPQQKALIEQAKALLMERNHMSEEEAHRYLQKSSMDSGTNILEMAQMVLTVMKDT